MKKLIHLSVLIISLFIFNRCNFLDDDKNKSIKKETQSLILNDSIKGMQWENEEIKDTFLDINNYDKYDTKFKTKLKLNVKNTKEINKIHANENKSEYQAKSAEDSILYCSYLDKFEKKIGIKLYEHKNKILFLNTWLHENYFKKFYEFDIQKIVTNENFDVYSISFSKNLPINYKHYSIIYNKKNRYTFLVPIEFNDIYKINGKIMIGGFECHRFYEYYVIYELKKHKIKAIFNTIWNYKRIIIGFINGENECVEYKPNRFNYKYTYREISFSGEMLFFCKPRCDRLIEQKVPLSKKHTEIKYKYKNGKWLYDKKSIYSEWRRM